VLDQFCRNIRFRIGGRFDSSCINRGQSLIKRASRAEGNSSARLVDVLAHKYIIFAVDGDSLLTQVRCYGESKGAESRRIGIFLVRLTESALAGHAIKYQGIPGEITSAQVDPGSSHNEDSSPFESSAIPGNG
jgi:hypothetical protein